MDTLNNSHDMNSAKKLKPNGLSDSFDDHAAGPNKADLSVPNYNIKMKRELSFGDLYCKAI